MPSLPRTGYAEQRAAARPRAASPHHGGICVIPYRAPTRLRVQVRSGVHGTSVSGRDDQDEIGLCPEPPAVRHQAGPRPERHRRPAARRSRLRKSTGRRMEEIKKTLQAGRLTTATREAAGQLASPLSLDQLALLAEFQDDPEALQQVMTAIRHGSDGEYAAQRIRQDRAEAAAHEQLRTQLEAAGVTVTDGLPESAVHLAGLLHDLADLTPDTHADCPGRGVYIVSWDRLHPVHYCASPAEHGHTIRDLLAQSSSAAGAGTAAPDAHTPAGGGTIVNMASLAGVTASRAWPPTSPARPGSSASPRSRPSITLTEVSGSMSSRPAPSSRTTLRPPGPRPSGRQPSPRPCAE